MAVYGPRCHPQNIIWTEAKPAIPNHIVRPVSRWAYKNEFGQNPEENIILIGPSQYTKILTGQYYTVIDWVRGLQLLFEESVYN
jgi:hypothetical protein